MSTTASCGRKYKCNDNDNKKKFVYESGIGRLPLPRKKWMDMKGDMIKKGVITEMMKDRLTQRTKTWDKKGC